MIKVSGGRDSTQYFYSQKCSIFHVKKIAVALNLSGDRTWVYTLYGKKKKSILSFYTDEIPLLYFFSFTVDSKPLKSE